MLKTRTILNVLSAIAMVGVLTVPATSAQAAQCSSNRSYHSSNSRSHSRSGFGFHLDFNRGRVSVHSGSHHKPVCRPSRTYVPGYYKTVTNKVLVRAGHYDSVYHAAEYRTQYDRYGNACRVLVQAAHYDKKWHPAEYRYQTSRVWVPGHWH